MTGPSPPLLQVSGLRISYGLGSEAVHDVSLTVQPGAIVAVLGPNGSGKTSTLRAISGLLPVHSGHVRAGSVWLDGAPVTGNPASKMVRAGVVHVPEGRQMFKSLSVRENLLAGAHTRRRRKDEVRLTLTAALDLFPELVPLLDRPAGYLSGGEQQMVAIGRCMMAAPTVLLLDEPSLGLAPLIVMRIRDAIVNINRSGTSVLLVEQNASMALSIAAHALVLESGVVALSGNAASMLKGDEVADVYLGRGRPS